ncbi:cuticular protein RR-2 family member 8 precursor [Nasonia vitripennis]|uniref:Uncharacterized protein n=1 Tax=Nasonia vitripennis TaxID=7425 RepID=A0A7M6UVN1_NASVI|nr:cuticular protein RR-2 family member 8 precursor [Nasonia vitripennis]
MACKTLALLCLAAGIACIQSAAVVPVATAPVLAKIENLDAPAQYSFAYDVQDSITGDSKAQYETRTGDVVQGSYSLIEADGSRRIVDYTADPVNGFNAVVNREPAVAAVAPVVTKTVVEAPVAAPVIAARTVAAAPVVARTVAAAPVAAPVFARTVAAAPVIARSAVAAPVAAPVAGPVFARTVAAGPVVAARAVAAAPVYQAYTLPRAVATRVGVPLTYPAYI